MRDLWLSLHPKWAEAIVEGRKTAELRRRAPRVEPGATAVLYATAPQCAVIGTAEILSINLLDIGSLWTEFGRRSAVSRSQFFEYFEGTSLGCAIELTGVQRSPRPVTLTSLRELGLEPAQGWRYLTCEVVSELLAATRVAATASDYV